MHAVSGLDSALLASPRMLAALVVQCGNRLAPPAGQLAGSTFQELLPAARQASGEAAGSKLGRQLAQTTDALEAALRAEAAEPAVHLARVEQLGTQLAQLMHQYWEQPAQVQAAHLEQGQAAAARACAYFRCGNLLADRGAAAGESGSKLRCRCDGRVWGGCLGLGGALRSLAVGHPAATVSCSLSVKPNSAHPACSAAVHAARAAPSTTAAGTAPRWIGRLAGTSACARRWRRRGRRSKAGGRRSRGRLLMQRLRHERADIGKLASEGQSYPW